MACIDSLVSACLKPMRSRILSTAEPRREMRDNGVVLASTIERCRSDALGERLGLHNCSLLYRKYSQQPLGLIVKWCHKLKTQLLLRKITIANCPCSWGVVTQLSVRCLSSGRS